MAMIQSIATRTQTGASNHTNRPLKRIIQCVQVYGLLSSSTIASVASASSVGRPNGGVTSTSLSSLSSPPSLPSFRHGSHAAFVGSRRSNTRNYHSWSSHLATVPILPSTSHRVISTNLVNPASSAGLRSSSSVGLSASKSDNNDNALNPIVSVSDTYDGGNGEFVSAEMAGDEDDFDVVVKVNIRADPYTDLEQKQHFQSFSFRSTLHAQSPSIQSILQKSKSSSIKVKYIIPNAGKASYAPAWQGSSIFVTSKSTPFDPDSWSRTGDTSYEEESGELSWTHVHELGEEGNICASSAYFAYFPPYSYERHLGLIAKCAETEGCKVSSLGQTVSGREIECLTIGSGKNVCWIIHRQHPGESMAEFYAEGLLSRLLGLDNGELDDVAKIAREQFTFNIVPNINPDGSANGYLRVNAAGSNLNREWAPSPAPMPTDSDGENGEIYEAPTLQRSPEVFHVLRRMDQTGCDAFLDIHGDEALPFNFLAGSQGMPNWGKRLESLHGAFLAAYERANPDMQGKVSYDPDEPNEGMKNICSNQIALRFDCFSGTLEMPFKEVWGGEKGWGPDRARNLGASALDALCYVSPYLREEGVFWKKLPEEDFYVHPSSKYD